jgi:hypothetical protein
MFGNQQRELGKIEHLALFDIYRRPRIERRTAMLADARHVRNHEIGFGDLAQRAARVALLPAARLARLAAQALGIRGFFFNPSLEGGWELFELSCPNCRRSAATSASSAAIWRFSEAINSSTSAGTTIPPLMQIRRPSSRGIRCTNTISTNLWHFGLTPRRLAVTAD